jgi:hypothetical protein
MISTNHPCIRRLLHQYHDGLTSIQIAERLDRKRDTVYRALRDMPDTYIDRWTIAKIRQPSEAVWCAVVPPEDCPKPTKKLKVKNDK